MTPRAVARAVIVSFGGSVVLDLLAATAAARVAGALARRRRPPRAAFAGVVLAAVYATRVRRWMGTWGATADELRDPLPGDVLVPHPASRRTRAVTVDAPPEAVWPWVAQIGADRGGFYSYDLLENLAGCRLRSAEKIHPEWQHRDVGELVMMHPTIGAPVAAFEPGQALVLAGWGAFVVRALPDGRTRLLARSSTPRGPQVLFNVLLLELPHFVMERRMLLGIEARAERAWRARGAVHAPARATV